MRPPLTVCGVADPVPDSVRLREFLRWLLAEVSLDHGVPGVVLCEAGGRFGRELALAASDARLAVVLACVAGERPDPGLSRLARGVLPCGPGVPPALAMVDASDRVLALYAGGAAGGAAEAVRRAAAAGKPVHNYWGLLPG